MKKLIIGICLGLLGLVGYSQDVILGNKATANILYANDSSNLGSVRYKAFDEWYYLEQVTIDSTTAVDGDTAVFITAPGDGYHIVIERIDFTVVHDGTAYTDGGNDDTLKIHTYNNGGEIVTDYIITATTLTSTFDDDATLSGKNSSIGNNQPYWYDFPDDISASGNVGYFILRFKYAIRPNDY